MSSPLVMISVPLAVRVPVNVGLDLGARRAREALRLVTSPSPRITAVIGFAGFPVNFSTVPAPGRIVMGREGPLTCLTVPKFKVPAGVCAFKIPENKLKNKIEKIFIICLYTNF